MPKRLPPKAAPKASIIVVTHNSEKFIEECLHALLDQDYPSGFEVVVVDNGSSDTTRRLVARFPKVRLVPSTNRGFGAGNNLGARHAQGEILAFANPDTVAEPGWLRHLVEPLATPKTVTTSQILLVDEPGRINTIGLDLHFMGFSFVRDYRGPATQGGPVPVAGFSGAAFAFRKADYEALGGFDERIFLYGEDTELAWRAQTDGYRILAVPASRIRHHYTFQMSAKKLYWLEFARQLLLRRYFGGGRRILYAPSRLVARMLVTRMAAGLGPDAKKQLRQARLDARKAPDVPPLRPRIRRFARRSIPFRTAFPDNASARRLGFLPNAAFAVNAPLIPSKGTRANK